MALDGALLRLIKEELTPLIGAHVDKIHQPAKDTVIMAMRTREGGKRLLLNAAANSARIHMTEAEMENPQSPPMFCMLLRKHIGGGKLMGLRQDGLERILYLDFLAMNEMGDMVEVTLACEIMGRCSNIILISKEGRVIDSIKRVDEEMSRERMVLPGMTYSLPPRSRRCSVAEDSGEEIRRVIAEGKSNCESQQRDMAVHKFLIGAFEGISPIIAREAACYADKGADKTMVQLSANDVDRLVFFMNGLKEILNGEKAPAFTLVLDKDGIAKDFTFVEPWQYDSLMVKKPLNSASELLDTFFSKRDADNRMHQRAEDLFKLLVNATDRISRKLALQKEELEACKDRDEKRILGDLISANLYKLKGDKGSDRLVAERYDLPFEGDSPVTVTIPLDPRLTPSQNAQRYYSEYRKAQKAEEMLTSLIVKGKEELIYLDSVFDALTRSTCDQDVIELKLELASEGYLKAAKLKHKQGKIRQQQPLKYRSSDGFLILVGRNNVQNDKLTLKTAEKTDLWLHTQNITGSHVIVEANGKPLPNRTIEEAAVIAAYNSKARNSSKVPVDYTLARYVKKPAGSKPGMVIFTNNQTAVVDPDEELVERLKTK